MISPCDFLLQILNIQSYFLLVLLKDLSLIHKVFTFLIFLLANQIIVLRKMIYLQLQKVVF